MIVKYPTRARPELFRRQLGAYLLDPSVRILVTCDSDDETMNNPAMRDYMTQERVTVRWGRSRSKIEAVNDGVKEAKWDLLILGADDMVPVVPDYAQRIVELFDKHFPDGDGVLHLNDGRTRRKLNTLPILDRKYFDRFGYVYAPDYVSLWADNEFQAVSEQLGRAVYIDEVLIRHDWIGTHAPDELHKRNETFNHADRVTFRQRRAAGFPRLETMEAMK